MNPRKVIFIALCACAAVACSTTRALPEGEYLLRKNSVQANDPSFDVSELNSYIGHKPNSYIAGMNPLLSVYNWGGDGSTPLKSFLRNIGTQPVVYDPEKVAQSVANIASHLTYVGYYGSEVESEVRTLGRKAYVTYKVKLGKRYRISDIDYDLPTYGTFRDEFMEDLGNSLVRPGDYLSESALETEADRSAAFFRTQGYYGFTKSYYAFEADTLSGDGGARLIFSIRDYALGDSPSTAREHQKYTMGEVQISHPEALKVRPSVLENLNTLRPGDPYNEEEINTAYSRFSSVGALSGVTIDLQPAQDNKVDCSILLRNAGLQGFKTNLEASVNSTGLMGISPQLTYYHRNVFHGGEQLNLGIKGNFQFKPKTGAYSTDLNVSSTLSFPQILGVPNRVFTGPNIPKTDISMAFSYQDRPEFRRTVIASAYTFNGRLGSKLYYQITPFRANISRLYNMDQDFMFKLLETNPFMLMAYLDNFDMGVSALGYYTTDASAIPTTPYHYIRLGVDLSGNTLSLLNGMLPTGESGQHTIWNTPYTQYVRAELNLGKVFRFGKEDRQALALHLGGGMAYAYGNASYAPVEKQFYVGGAMSMRGWQARTLGPGTSPYEALFSIPSQVGAMKLEANAEYRFPILSKVEGALFLDAGNIWEVDDYGDGSCFHLSTLPESIAMDWGVGLRLNLTFILLRLDTGIRLHDPAREAGQRWVPVKEWRDGNYAIHFGVGYPF